MPVLTKINTNSIAEDAITGDKFAGDAYLSNTANQNISGTYSENRMYTSDAYTLSGNTTINSNVVLSTVKPNSDVVLTAGGAYTLTGTGILSGGDMYGRTSLTGMTGELGSAVTGAPALTGLGTVTSGTYNSSIGTSAAFPAGHVLQVVRKSVYSYVDSSGTTNAWENDTNDLHINVTKGNLIIATVCGGMFNAGTAVTGYWRLIRFSEGGGSANQDIWTTTCIGYNAAVYHYASTQTASVIATHTGEMLIKRGSDNSGSTGNTAWASDTNNYGPVHYHAMEIQQ